MIANAIIILHVRTASGANKVLMEIACEKLVVQYSFAVFDALQ